MRIEDQVCSLELAKRLKQLRVEQNSYFFYEWYSDNAYRLASPHDRADPMCGATIIDAFTVAELGKMLPHKIKNKYVQFHKDKDGFTITYKDCNNHIHYFCQLDKIEANVRAKVLIYLIENELIKENE